MKWVSVKDRLPPEDVELLFYTKDKEVKTGVLLRLGNCNDYMIFGAGITHYINGVTHWMNLPEPPKEEDNDNLPL